MRMKRDTQPFPQQRKCKEVARRQRRKARALSNVSEGCKEVARRMAEKDPGGGGLWRMHK